MSRAKKAVEMPRRGKRGKPTAGFPLFPPRLEIALRFPHSHRPNDSGFISILRKPTPVGFGNCHPCPRSKVLPMSPALQSRVSRMAVSPQADGPALT